MNEIKEDKEPIGIVRFIIVAALIMFACLNIGIAMGNFLWGGS
jgi:hypothetical protein